MSIIAISADSYSKDKELSEKVGKKIGYECVDQEAILSASEEFGVPKSKLVRAIEDVPSVFSRGSQRYLAYIEAAFAEYMLKDNIVYSGLVGYPLIQGVSHVLKVRIVANLEDRIHLAMKQENISEEKARNKILNEDEHWKKWAKAVYGIDITNSHLYDLVINVGHIQDKDTKDAIETIAGTVKHKKFQPMTYSLECMKNSALSCRIRAALIDIDPKIEVKSDKGAVFVCTKAVKRKKQQQGLNLKQRVMKIDGVKHVEVYGEKKLFLSTAHGQ
ncbi:MAG: cytidylate kinase-like family protein [Pseudomonadota bacterium]